MSIGRCINLYSLHFNIKQRHNTKCNDIESKCTYANTCLAAMPNTVIVSIYFEPITATKPAVAPVSDNMAGECGTQTAQTTPHLFIEQQFLLLHQVRLTAQIGADCGNS